MYENLTKYLDEIKMDDIGTWTPAKEKNENGMRMIIPGFLNYSRWVIQFIKDVNEFVRQYSDMDLHHYHDILETYGILKNGPESVAKADASKMDAGCALTCLVYVVRGDYFSQGFLYEFLENGCISKWLRRLKELDNQGNE